MTALLRRLFGDPTRCRCGHPRTAHEHWRAGDDCGPCGPDVCPRFRRARHGEHIDIADVCADPDVIDAIHAGDYDRARDIAGDEFVTMLVSPQFAEALLTSWADAGRRR